MAHPNASVEMNAKRPPNIPEVHILWSPDGLGCDGDTVSITAATLPSIEDILLGTIPGLPKVHLHNRVLAAENGDEYMEAWYAAARGELAPFILVIEGSIPNENIKSEGYWAGLGTGDETGQPSGPFRVRRSAISATNILG